MHMRGDPNTMNSLADYGEGNSSDRDAALTVTGTITQELEARARAADEAGIPRWLQVLDPGIGFAKKTPHNLALLHPRALQRLRSTCSGSALLVGASRKRFIGEITG